MQDNPIKQMAKELIVHLKRRCQELANEKKPEEDEIRWMGKENQRLFLKNRSGFHYVKKKDWKTIAAPLLQRKYDMMIVENDRIWMAILEQLLKLQDDGDVMELVRDDVRDLIKPRPLVSDMDVARWLARPRDRFIDRYGEHPYKTEGGEMVRSKSELMISNRLHAREVVYLYEFPLRSADGTHTYYPDFTILNRRTGREYIYEHLGMMGDPKYMKANMDKMAIYAQLGFVLGDNLFLTFECEGCPLDLGLLDIYIERFFT